MRIDINDSSAGSAKTHQCEVRGHSLDRIGAEISAHFSSLPSASVDVTFDQAEVRDTFGIRDFKLRILEGAPCLKKYLDIGENLAARIAETKGRGVHASCWGNFWELELVKLTFSYQELPGSKFQMKLPLDVPG